MRSKEPILLKSSFFSPSTISHIACQPQRTVSSQIIGEDGLKPMLHFVFSGVNSDTTSGVARGRKLKEGEFEGRLH